MHGIQAFLSLREYCGAESYHVRADRKLRHNWIAKQADIGLPIWCFELGKESLSVKTLCRYGTSAVSFECYRIRRLKI